MSNWIQINGRDILCLSNRAFHRLYEQIENLVEKEKISDQNILHILERMDQDTYGGGAIILDLNKYLSKPSDIAIFIYLVKKAYLNLIEEKFADESVQERMNPFIAELESYYEKIKPQPE